MAKALQGCRPHALRHDLCLLAQLFCLFLPAMRLQAGILKRVCVCVSGVHLWACRNHQQLHGRA